MKEVHKDIAIFGRKVSEVLAEAYDALLKDDDVHNILVDHIIVPKEWVTIIQLNPKLFDVVTRKELVLNGLIAFLWGASIYIDVKPEVCTDSFELYTDEEKDKGVKYIFHMKPFV